MDVLLFMIITVAFHKLYWLGHRYLAGTFVDDLQDWMARQVYLVSLWFDTAILRLKITPGEPNYFHFLNGESFYINEGCSGLKQFYQVAVLFLLFPGPWKHKAWFIPFGMFIMFLTNIFRIVVLSLVMEWSPANWHFVHDWILRPFFYVVLFFLWVWWVEKFRRRKAQKKVAAA